MRTVDTERQTLPSRVVLNMTHRGSHCPLVWCWIRPRWKLRWKYVKRWWEGCLGVVSRNGDIRDIKQKMVGGLLYGFRLMSYGLMPSRWAFAPIPGQIYPRETTDSASVSTRTRRLFGYVGCCPCFFLAHCFSDIFQGVHDQAITSVLLSLIRSHTIFDDLDVTSVRKVKLHSHCFFFFDKFLFDNN